MRVTEIRSANRDHMAPRQSRLDTMDGRTYTKDQARVVRDFLFQLRIRLRMSDANLNAACIAETEENGRDVVVLHCDS